MTGHPDADVLAEFREGLLGRRRSGRIRAHLAGCPRCAAADRGLAEVTALLASTPAARMPDDLAGRLDAALAAEAAARASVPGPAERPRRQRRVPALRIAAAAAAAIAVAGGGYGLTRLTHHPITAAGSGGTSSRVSGGGHLPLGPERTQNGTDASTQPGASLAAPVTVIHSGTDYQPGSLAAQAGAVLDGHRPAAVTPAGQAADARLQGCVRLIAAGARPRLVDMARYRGRPATIIVAPAAASRQAQVWVVGPGCSAASRDVIAHAALAAAG